MEKVRRLSEGRIVVLDAASARHIDENGYLHVSGNALTRDQVAPYYGAELPPHEGLEPDRIYYAYRPGEELRKSLDTYNGVPLLIQHEFDSADEPLKELRVGSIGTNAQWDEPFLRNDLTVWDKSAIEKIMDGSLRELSCGYTFSPEWKPGKTADGIDYDLVMRDIKCNHVALVERGRATGCKVADESLPINVKEPQMESNEKPIADDFTEWCRRVIESAGLELPAEKIDALVRAFAEGHAEYEKKAAENAKAEIEGTREDEDKPAEPVAAPEGKPEDEDCADEEKPAEQDEDCKDEDACDEDDPKAKAGDAAIIAKAVDAAKAHIVSLFDAAEAIRPVAGAVKATSFDSAAAIYQHGLKALGIKGISDAAAPEVFRTALALRGKQEKAAPAADTNTALDAALARIK
jgi:hypothetical protein